MKCVRDEEMKSWVDNCLVPILVKEYLSEMQAKKPVETDPNIVAECRIEASSRRSK